MRPREELNIVGGRGDDLRPVMRSVHVGWIDLDCFRRDGAVHAEASVLLLSVVSVLAPIVLGDLFYDAGQDH